MIWLHNVKDPSSRLLRWRLRLEQYKYNVQYVNGKQNKAANCLSGLFPITSPDILSKALENTDMEGKGNAPKDKLPKIKILDRGLSISKSKKLKPTTIGHEIVGSKIKIKLPERRVIEFSKESTSEESESPKNNEQDSNLFDNYLEWKANLVTNERVKVKPNAAGKLWKKIERDNLPNYNEEKWLRCLGWFIDDFKNKKSTIIRLHFGDPLFTPIEREEIIEMINYLSNYYADSSLHLCFNQMRELTKQERGKVMREARGDHLGENNTISKARAKAEWARIDEEIKKYVKSCPICQLQKAVRITNRATGIIPDIPLNRHEKVAMDIFGPLLETRSGNKYTLNILDRLTRHTLLLPKTNETSERNLDNLMEHYIYVFGAPQVILADQGLNF